MPGNGDEVGEGVLLLQQLSRARTTVGPSRRHPRTWAMANTIPRSSSESRATGKNPAPSPTRRPRTARSGRVGNLHSITVDQEIGTRFRRRRWPNPGARRTIPAVVTEDGRPIELLVAVEVQTVDPHRGQERCRGNPQPSVEVKLLAARHAAEFGVEVDPVRSP